MTRLAALTAPRAACPNDDVASRAPGGHDAVEMAGPAGRTWRRSLARWAGRLAAAGAVVALAACGGTADDFEDCSQVGQKEWVGRYMNDWYFWYQLSPRPNPASFNDVLDYYDALLYTGGTAPFLAADRYSRSESTESFNRFYGDGATMGYGVAVNGFEVQPGQPLYVRYVEPASDAAVQGVQRGDEVLSADDGPVWRGGTRSLPVAVGDAGGATPDGIVGLSGNAREWVLADDHSTALLKGGSWNSTDPGDLRVAARIAAAETLPGVDFGFRCVHAAEGSQP